MLRPILQVARLQAEEPWGSLDEDETINTRELHVNSAQDYVER